MKRFRGELAIKAHRHLYHSTLDSRIIRKKKKVDLLPCAAKHLADEPRLPVEGCRVWVLGCPLSKNLRVYKTVMTI